MKIKHEILWLFFIFAVINLIDFYLGRVFAKGFCFGVLAASLIVFWEAGRAKP